MQFNKTILKICLISSCLLLNFSAVGLPRIGGANSFMAFENLVGRKFNRLTVVSYSHETGKNIKVWNCVCECGGTTKSRGSGLKNGTSKSCGCLKVEKAKIPKPKTHGEGGTVNRTTEYQTWVNIKLRCRDKNNPIYGGRGIKVCERWLNSFEDFLADMGRKPSPAHSIERTENNGNYEPSNCKWATRKEQADNRRSNVILTHNGQSMNVKQWAEHTGINERTIYSRLNRGASHSEALDPFIQTNESRRKKY